MKRKEFAVGKKRIWGDNPCFIVAEAGINHNGDINIAKKLIDSAAEAECDAIKFQLFKAEKLYPKDAGEIKWKSKEGSYTYDIFKEVKKNELPISWIDELIDYCNSRNILFFSSVEDESSADVLEKAGVKIFKLTSYAVTHLPLITYIAKKNIPLILSTGGATIEEIKGAYNIIKQYNLNFALLHCVIQYPAPLKDVNMNVLDTLRMEFPEAVIGYSDHTEDPVKAPVAAIVKGAKIIEKHITLDKNMKGPDHFFALDPDQLKQMVQAVRVAEQKMKNKESISLSKDVLGSSNKTLLKGEQSLRKFAYRCIFASKKIKQGEKITSCNIKVLRPGNKKKGLEPKFYDELITKKYIAKRDISCDEPLRWQDVMQNG